MTYLLVIASAMVVSLFIIPVMIRLAPTLGMIDEPDDRKVHSTPVPRVGGWGIILGSMLPILFLVRMDAFLATFVFGAFTLLMFGALDDSKEMGHYPKFVGQFLAVIPVVTLGGLSVTHFPFFGYFSVPVFFSVVFTVIALIGMINAVNHSDGLDGLAGGETIISLGAFALLSYLSNAHLGIVISISALGAILGFMRYNMHPAAVFMGDGGSQFLGFSLGILAVFITQKVDTSLSPAIVLFLLGMPVVDIVVVVYKRAVAGGSLFLATRNHIHHRLLDLGLPQKESVVVIYAIHALFVFCGIWMRHTADWIIVAAYLIAVASIYILLGRAERCGWRPESTRLAKVESKTQGNQKSLEFALLVAFPRKLLSLMLPVYFVVVALFITSVPVEYGLIALLITVLVLLQCLGLLPMYPAVGVPVLYIAAGFVIYLCVNDRPSWNLWWLKYLEIVFYGSVVGSVILSVFFSPRRRIQEFRITAFDYLVVLVGIGSLPFIRAVQHGPFNAGLYVVILGVVLYGCKLLAVERQRPASLLNLSALAALTVIAVRGLGALNYSTDLALAMLPFGGG